MATKTNPFMEGRTAVFTLDVTGGDSGTTGTKILGKLPEDAVITQAWIHVVTTCTSANDSGTLALGYSGAATAFDAATAISSGTTWDAAVPRVSDAAADGAVGNFVTAAAGDNILATIATQDFTAGKVLLIIKYYLAR